MNDLEQRLYSRGLENLYGSVLLGEDRALTQIENMVYLTREFTAPARSRRSVEQEVTFIRSFCQACWPDAQIDVQVEGDAVSHQVMRGSLSEPVCREILRLEHHGKIPGLLVLQEHGRDLQYRLEEGGRIVARGEVSDE